MSADFPDHPFWDFSLSVYMTKDVPPACLVIQNNHQIDVNILLFCCWLGASGRGVMTPEELERVKGAVGPWHQDVVRALRAVRSALKDGMDPAPRPLSDAMRKRIAKTEIDCEHVEQLMLAAALDLSATDGKTENQRAADAVANVDAYFGSLGLALGSDDTAALATIVGEAFKGLEATQIEALCGEMRVAQRP